MQGNISTQWMKNKSSVWVWSKGLISITCEGFGWLKSKAEHINNMGQHQWWVWMRKRKQSVRRKVCNSGWAIWKILLWDWWVTNQKTTPFTTGACKYTTRLGGAYGRKKHLDSWLTLADCNALLLDSFYITQAQQKWSPSLWFLNKGVGQLGVKLCSCYTLHTISLTRIRVMFSVSYVTKSLQYCTYRYSNHLIHSIGYT